MDNYNYWTDLLCISFRYVDNKWDDLCVKLFLDATRTAVCDNNTNNVDH